MSDSVIIEELVHLRLAVLDLYAVNGIQSTPGLVTPFVASHLMFACNVSCQATNRVRCDRIPEFDEALVINQQATDNGKC